MSWAIRDSSSRGVPFTEPLSAPKQLLGGFGDGARRFSVVRRSGTGGRGWLVGPKSKESNSYAPKASRL